MKISNQIADFAAAIDAAKAELATVTQKIEELQNQRSLVERAQPHTDDIVAVFMRGLDQSRKDFERQFSSHLSSHFVGPEAAEAAGPSKAAGLLRMEPAKLDREAQITRSMTGAQAEINTAVLTYFLGEAIAAEIPALVERLCPSARNGLKLSERKARLAELDAQIGVLTAERDALNNDLIQARGVIR